jgi:hypothetical protein
MDDNIRISDAQQAHLSGLISARDQINAEIQRFMGYLLTEHKLDKAKDWRVRPDGRIEEVPPVGQNEQE